MLRSCLAVCGFALVVLGVATTGALAAPGFQGEGSTPPDVDAREGRVAPSDRQRSLASGLRVTWNRFGTPHAVAPRNGYLATGLSSDQTTAARQWISRNRGLLGIGAAAAGDLEVVTATDQAVLLRQRFDGISAGRDGLIAIGVRNGRARTSPPRWRPTPRSPAPATWAPPPPSAPRPPTRGSPPGRCPSPHAARLDRARRRRARPPGAGPAGDGADAEGRRPPCVGDVAARRRPWHGLVRRRRDRRGAGPREPRRPPRRQPDLDGVPQLATAELRHHRHARALVLAGDHQLRAGSQQPGLAAVGRRRRRPTSRPPRRAATTPSPSTTGTATSRAVARHRAGDAHDRPRVRVPVDEPVVPATLQPGHDIHVAQRNDIDAARANLFAMHNRMHDWSYGLGFTEPTWNLQTYNFNRGGAENDREHGNAQAGGRSGGPPGFRRATTPISSRPPTACCRSRTCTCGSRSRQASTRRAWTATTTCR